MPAKKPKALVSLSNFKGHLSNLQACEIVANELKKKSIPATIQPIGDGGSGTLAAIQSCKEGVRESFEVSKPLVGKTQAEILCIPDSKRPSTLYIESASACGHSLIEEKHRNAMRASSIGLGELIKQASGRWADYVHQIYVGLGDSAVSDAGMGMLTALGFVFRDWGGKQLWGNAAGLRQIQKIDLPSERVFPKAKFTILCDVLNPLCGPTGSARTFAPQKGASTGEVELIEQGMENFVVRAEELTHQSVRYEPMTGAAGGLAAAFRALLNANLVRGAQFLFDWLQYDRLLQEHSFLITGEGKTDQQTLAGKAPFECITRADKLDKKVVIISGRFDKGHEAVLRCPSVVAAHTCGNQPTAEEALAKKTEEIFSDSTFVQSLL